MFWHQRLRRSHRGRGEVRVREQSPFPWLSWPTPVTPLPEGSPLARPPGPPHPGPQQTDLPLPRSNARSNTRSPARALGAHCSAQAEFSAPHVCSHGTASAHAHRPGAGGRQLRRPAQAGTAPWARDSQQRKAHPANHTTTGSDQPHARSVPGARGHRRARCGPSHATEQGPGMRSCWS